MATPRELVETVAESLGTSVGTVVVHDRNLSTAPVPLRTVAGRGRAAARVTYVDAVNLLIAAAASESAKDSVMTVLAYRDLRNRVAHPSSGVQQYDELPAHHTFGQGLTAFIVAAATKAFTSGKLNLKFKFFGPRPKAKIEWEEDGQRFCTLYDSISRRPARDKGGPLGDLERSITITEKSIFRIGDTVGGSP
jgi:hypothetical protein